MFILSYHVVAQYSKFYYKFAKFGMDLVNLLWTCVHRWLLRPHFWSRQKSQWEPIIGAHSMSAIFFSRSCDHMLGNVSVYYLFILTSL